MELSPISAFLVSLQLVLIGLIVWPFAPQRFGAVFWSLIAASITLGAFTLFHNRLGNFNIRPEPKASARLITSGPYRLIRHPMYTALLIAAAAFVVAENIWLKVGLWIALGLILTAKATFEERLMSGKFPAYSAYRERTKRFAPWLW